MTDQERAERANGPTPTDGDDRGRDRRRTRTCPYDSRDHLERHRVVPAHRHFGTRFADLSAPPARRPNGADTFVGVTLRGISCCSRTRLVRRL